MKKYAHYLTYFGGKKDPMAFSAFIADVRAIVDHAPDGAKLCGQTPDGPPIINDRVLTIGSAENPSPFSSLKIRLRNNPTPGRFPMIVVRTDRLTYDSTICACMLAFLHHFPLSEVTSDGTRRNWKKAIEFYEFVTERKAPELFLRQKKEK